jgi:REP element-mobilizing transposase RayT
MLLPEDDKRGVVVTHNRMPHWALSGSVYFITWCVQDGLPGLTPEERAFVVSCLKKFDGERYRLLAYVVIDDHVHVIFQPVGLHRPAEIVHSWKSYSSKEINKLRGRSGTFWQKSYWDYIIRNEQQLYEKLNNILNNPQKRWPEVKHYPWVEFIQF